MALSLAACLPPPQHHTHTCDRCFPPCPSQVFNQHLMLPAHQSFPKAHVDLRIMDYKLWVNSKVFFR